MSVDSWTPPDSDQSIDKALLDKALEISATDQLESLAQLHTDDEAQRLAAIMRLPEARWRETLEHYSSDQLHTLLRFFVRAETLVSGCDVADQNPAIWINRLLKRRGEKLSRDELSWIRTNTTNRFIPNGAL